MTNIKKKCNKCQEEKDIGQFNTNGWSGEKRSFKPYCKPCGKVIFKENYKEAIIKHFGELKCSKCGFEGNLIQYDVHHLKPEDKSFAISRNFAKATNSKKKFKAELDKCIILCVNCHRLEHTIRAGE